MVTELRAVRTVCNVLNFYQKSHLDSDLAILDTGYVLLPRNKSHVLIASDCSMWNYSSNSFKQCCAYVPSSEDIRLSPAEFMSHLKLVLVSLDFKEDGS